MNYTELSQAIQDYTENDETSFVNNIPTFVKQAEERIKRAVIIPELRKNVTTTFVASDKYLNTPSDFLAVFSIAAVNGSGDYEFLLPKDVNFIREAYASGSTEGLPQYYALFDYDFFIFGPTPDTNYTVELHYYYDTP